MDVVGVDADDLAYRFEANFTVCALAVAACVFGPVVLDLVTDRAPYLVLALFAFLMWRAQRLPTYAPPATHERVVG